MSIKKMLLAVGLAIGLMLSGRASAQEIPQGPFQNAKYLVNAWFSFVPSQAATVYLDGQVVFTRAGAGPAVGGWYFTCPSDGYVRTNCPTEGPFLNVNALIEYWSQYAPAGSPGAREVGTRDEAPHALSKARLSFVATTGLLLYRAIFNPPYGLLIEHPYR